LCYKREYSTFPRISVHTEKGKKGGGLSTKEGEEHKGVKPGKKEKFLLMTSGDRVSRKEEGTRKKKKKKKKKKHEPRKTIGGERKKGNQESRADWCPEGEREKKERTCQLRDRKGYLRQSPPSLSVPGKRKKASHRQCTWGEGKAYSFKRKTSWIAKGPSGIPLYYT